MKQAMFLFLTFVLCISLCACGKSSEKPAKVKQDPAVEHQKVLNDIAESAPGTTVRYGTYDQDHYEEEGAQPITWIVLENSDGRAVLMAQKALDCLKFDSDTGVWRDSEIREWLNDDFFNTAFSELERSSILISDVNTVMVTGEEVQTQDQVYLLSEAELDTYFPERSNIHRLAQITGYSVDQGLEAYATTSLANTCNWWLRSGYGYKGQAVGGQMGNYGEVFEISSSHRYGVRPVICVDTTDLAD